MTYVLPLFLFSIVGLSAVDDREHRHRRRESDTGSHERRRSQRTHRRPAPDSLRLSGHEENLRHVRPPPIDPRLPVQPPPIDPRLQPVPRRTSGIPPDLSPRHRQSVPAQPQEDRRRPYDGAGNGPYMPPTPSSATYSRYAGDGKRSSTRSDIPPTPNSATHPYYHDNPNNRARSEMPPTPSSAGYPRHYSEDMPPPSDPRYRHDSIHNRSRRRSDMPASSSSEARYHRESLSNRSHHRSDVSSSIHHRPEPTTQLPLQPHDIPRPPNQDDAPSRRQRIPPYDEDDTGRSRTADRRSLDQRRRTVRPLKATDAGAVPLSSPPQDRRRRRETQVPIRQQSDDIGDQKQRRKSRPYFSNVPQKEDLTPSISDYRQTADQKQRRESRPYSSNMPQREDLRPLNLDDDQKQRRRSRPYASNKPIKEDLRPSAPNPDKPKPDNTRRYSKELQPTVEDCEEETETKRPSRRNSKRPEPVIRPADESETDDDDLERLNSRRESRPYTYRPVRKETQGPQSAQQEDPRREGRTSRMDGSSQTTRRNNNAPKAPIMIPGMSSSSLSGDEEEAGPRSPMQQARDRRQSIALNTRKSDMQTAQSRIIAQASLEWTARFEDYKIVESLNESKEKVFVAIHRATKRECVMKIDPTDTEIEAATRLINGAKQSGLSNVQNKFIVEYFLCFQETFKDGKTLTYLVMEHVETFVCSNLISHTKNKMKRTPSRRTYASVYKNLRPRDRAASLFTLQLVNAMRDLLRLGIYHDYINVDNVIISSFENISSTLIICNRDRSNAHKVARLVLFQFKDVKIANPVPRSDVMEVDLSRRLLDAMAVFVYELAEGPDSQIRPNYLVDKCRGHDTRKARSMSFICFLIRSIRNLREIFAHPWLAQ